MEPIFVTGIVFFFVYKIIELLVRQKARRIMVEKMTQISPEMLQQNIHSFNIFQNDGRQDNKFVMLRLGGLSLGIGIGWICGWLLGYHFNVTGPGWDNREILTSFQIAATALFSGIALIIVYLIERKAVKEAKKME